MSGRYAKVMGDHWRTRATKVSLAANGLWAVARTYIADNASDGVVHETFLAGLCGGKVDKRAVAELLEAGWWQPCDGGYLDATYLDENISRARAEKLREENQRRVTKHRTKNVTPPDGNDGGNGPRNGRSNETGNALHDALPSDTKTPRHQDTTAPAGQCVREPEGATPLGIVECGYGSALGESGGKYIANPGRDVPHWRAAHAAIVALSDPGEALRDAALRLAREYVAERRSRSPEWFAEWLQKRAASGPSRTRGGRVEPLPNSAYQGTSAAEIDELFGPRDEKAIAAIGRRRVV